eukprot:CAMPEP_0202914508 /NCGR_PEP_ID=MMETSP1392-20130828/63249_1 /ASSEMBLY_ACC=CAM_ASM_000868 /TAXON_ID=225041 /ORGANISM="Chlamydomonas chlamydogama, Strain SAG 11-48b" /LENGTH=81 /DNA_ID=CAMNT_0049606169 /DNA_START=1160 /DNA_END=1405 /DNA_ORIENTATION=-
MTCAVIMTYSTCSTRWPVVRDLMNVGLGPDLANVLYRTCPEHAQQVALPSSAHVCYTYVLWVGVQYVWYLSVPKWVFIPRI